MWWEPLHPPGPVRCMLSGICDTVSQTLLQGWAGLSQTLNISTVTWFSLRITNPHLLAQCLERLFHPSIVLCSPERCGCGRGPTAPRIFSTTEKRGDNLCSLGAAGHGRETAPGLRPPLRKGHSLRAAPGPEASPLQGLLRPSGSAGTSGADPLSGTRRFGVTEGADKRRSQVAPRTKRPRPRGVSAVATPLFRCTVAPVRGAGRLRRAGTGGRANRRLCLGSPGAGGAVPAGTARSQWAGPGLLPPGRAARPIGSARRQSGGRRCSLAARARGSVRQPLSPASPAGRLVPAAVSCLRSALQWLLRSSITRFGPPPLARPARPLNG